MKLGGLCRCLYSKENSEELIENRNFVEYSKILFPFHYFLFTVESVNPMSDNQHALNKYLSPLTTWALSFGCIVGWASFVMPGTTFLPLAGPLGTALGMTAGAVLMLLIGANYYFLMNRYPEAGGAFAYTKRIFGYDHGFLNAWFLAITYIALIWSNATAIALLSRRVFNNIFSFGFHYQVFDYEIYLTEVAISIIAVLIFAAVCIFKRLAAKLVTVMALFMFIAVIFIFS